MTTSFPMNAGNGPYSFSKNSQLAREVLRGLKEDGERCNYRKRKLDESLVDSFNLPMYFPSVEDMTKAVEKNDCFSIERIELTYPKSKLVDAKTLMINLRAVLEGLFINHFGSEIAKEACERTILKSDEISAWMEANYEKSCQLFVALKRK